MPEPELTRGVNVLGGSDSPLHQTNCLDEKDVQHPVAGKAGTSFTRMGSLPTSFSKPIRTRIVSLLVWKPGMTSTSRMREAGEKKRAR